MTPKFSIIIPTHARPQQLAACLGSCAQLAYPRDQFEVIVIDDGGGLAGSVVDQFRAQLDVTLVSQPRRGPAAARNAGARLSSGTYIAFTDDDCTLDPLWLHQLSTQFAEQPDAALGGHTINALPANLYSAASQLLVDFLYAYYAPRRDGSRFFTTNNFVVRRDTFLEIGGFHEFFRQAAAEDRELCFRLAHRGTPLVHATDAVVHHWHELSLSAFCRQHFRYGKGAARLHHVLAREFHHRVALEPANFYRDMLLRPFSERIGRPILTMSLCAVTQVAHAIGYCLEFLRLRLAKGSLSLGRTAIPMTRMAVAAAIGAYVAHLG